MVLKVSDDSKKAVAVEVNAESIRLLLQRTSSPTAVYEVSRVAEQAMDNKQRQQISKRHRRAANRYPTVCSHRQYLTATIGEKYEHPAKPRATEENGTAPLATHMGGKIPGSRLMLQTDVVNDAVRDGKTLPHAGCSSETLSTQTVLLRSVKNTLLTEKEILSVTDL